MPTIIAVAITTALGVGVLVVATRLLTRDAERDDAAWMHRVVALTAAAHVLIGVVVINSPRLIEAFGPDANVYDQGAVTIVDHWRHGARLPTSIGLGKEGFYYALAVLYWLMGHQRLAAVVLNVLLATLVVPVTADTARRLFGSRVYRPAALFVSVTPWFLVWSSQLLREGAILVTIAVALNLAVRLTDSVSVAAVAGLAGALTLLFTLRASIALPVLVGLLAALPLARRKVMSGVATSAAAIVAVVVAVLVAGVGVAGFTFVTTTSLSEMNVVRADLARSADSGFARDADASTAPKAVSYFPVGFVNVAFGPFPWTAANLLQLAGCFDAIALWFFLPSLWRGWRASRIPIGRTRYLLLAPAVLVTVLLSLLLGNYGAVVRERAQIIVLLVPFMALGWVVRPRPGLLVGVRHHGRTHRDGDEPPRSTPRPAP